jgi:hypothetical protein
MTDENLKLKRRLQVHSEKGTLFDFGMGFSRYREEYDHRQFFIKLRAYTPFEGNSPMNLPPTWIVDPTVIFHIIYVDIDDRAGLSKYLSMSDIWGCLEAVAISQHPTVYIRLFVWAHWLKDRDAKDRLRRYLPGGREGFIPLYIGHQRLEGWRSIKLPRFLSACTFPIGELE